MKYFFLILQLGISIILIVLILIQNSKGGLGSSIGGVDFYRTKRGIEKILFGFTLCCTLLFLVVSIINLLVN